MKNVRIDMAYAESIPGRSIPESELCGSPKSQLPIYPIDEKTPVHEQPDDFTPDDLPSLSSNNYDSYYSKPYFSTRSVSSTNTMESVPEFHAENAAKFLMDEGECDLVMDSDGYIISKLSTFRKSNRTHLLEKRHSEVESWHNRIPEKIAATIEGSRNRGRIATWWVEQMEQCCSCFPVLQPNDPYVEKWDVVMVILLLYVAIVSPYDTAFLATRLNAMFFLNRLVDIGFIIDMVIQFNLSFPGPLGRFVKDRSEVVHHYLKTWFFLDLISILPYEVVSLLLADTSLGSLQVLRIVRLFRLFKMFRLLRANRMFSRFEARMAINYSQSQLYAFLMMLFLLIHWFACGWYMVVVIEDNRECIHFEGERFMPRVDVEGQGDSCCHNWLDCYALAEAFQGPTAARKYFLAIWWSTAEVLTVSSDVSPITDAERTYQMIVRSMSGIVYAYLIGAVCNIFTSLSKDMRKFFEDMDSLNNFLYAHRLDETDNDLCVSLRMFFRFAHQCHGSTDASKAILQNLTPALKGRLACKVHSPWLKKVRVFRNIRLSPPFYVAISLALEQRIVSPLENLIEPHDKSDSIFIIEKGMVLSSGKVRTSGDTLGEECFWALQEDTIRGYAATSFTHGKVNVLMAKDFFEILSRAQFKVERKKVRKRIIMSQCGELILAFHRILKKGIEMPDFPEGCNYVRSKLPFVKVEALGPMFHVFSRFWQRTKPKDRTGSRSILKMLEKRHELAKNKSDLLARHRAATISDLTLLLKPFGFEDMAEEFFDKEELDVATLMDIDMGGLLGLGVPIAQAKRFCEYLKSTQKSRKKRVSNLLYRADNDRLKSVQALLKGTELEDFAWKLAIEEYMDAEMVDDATVSQFHSMGIPMGDAAKFQERRSKYRTTPRRYYSSTSL